MALGGPRTRVGVRFGSAKIEYPKYQDTLGRELDELTRTKDGIRWMYNPVEAQIVIHLRLHLSRGVFGTGPD